jgi:hypothetical protein
MTSMCQARRLPKEKKALIEILPADVQRACYCVFGLDLSEQVAPNTPSKLAMLTRRLLMQKWPQAAHRSLFAFRDIWRLLEKRLELGTNALAAWCVCLDDRAILHFTSFGVLRAASTRRSLIAASRAPSSYR